MPSPGTFRPFTRLSAECRIAQLKLTGFALQVLRGLGRCLALIGEGIVRAGHLITRRSYGMQLRYLRAVRREAHHARRVRVYTNSGSAERV